ncbi:hypothetical protein SMSP1_00535 [Sedimentisphaera salicampi]|nr:hypothetical protein SMSP1_00535 [Sedimentisphaera salicampi]
MCYPCLTTHQPPNRSPAQTQAVCDVVRAAGCMLLGCCSPAQPLLSPRSRVTGGGRAKKETGLRRNWRNFNQTPTLLSLLKVYATLSPLYNHFSKFFLTYCIFALTSCRNLLSLNSDLLKTLYRAVGNESTNKNTRTNEKSACAYILSLYSHNLPVCPKYRFGV